ncbi:MAG: NADH-quinone oxidoreductase subunit J [Deltaproteobacteria bacterium]|nr:NADH-quinone oxidoreductase subunit J [Deltaproteobacteria bacterium]
MSHLGYQIAFWIVAAVAVLRPSPSFRSVIRSRARSGWSGPFFATAAAFLMLNAPMVAVFQILVYAGAIMVFIIFVIMLINLRPQELIETRVRAVRGGAILFGVVATAAAFIGAIVFRGGAPSVGASFGQVETVAQVLYTRYAFAFEVLSLLLLIAVIGAVALAGKKDFTKE